MHQQFVRRFPGLGRAWDLVNEQGAAGPLDVRAQRLAKLAIAIGAMREGAGQKPSTAFPASGVHE